MNFEEIKKKIEELEIDESLFGHNALSDTDIDLNEVFGKITRVEKIGGHEGGGEDCSVVWFFEDHNVYIQWDGWYSSGNGSTWEETGFEVKPIKQLITSYVKVADKKDESLKDFCIELLNKLRDDGSIVSDLSSEHLLFDFF